MASFKLPIYIPDRTSVLTELEVLVDEEFLPEILRHNWALYYMDHSWRVIVNKNGKRILLHNFIWNLKYKKNHDKNYVLDHINHNSIDNRLCNLRLITHKQNNHNRRPRLNSSSSYKGVSKSRWNTWKATISIEGKNKNIGTFKTEIEAAEAYDKKAKEIFGEYAYLNFKQ